MRVLLVLLAGLLLAGCTSPSSESSPEDAGPLGRQELQALYEEAHDPRRHWITVRAGEGGPVFEGAHRLHPSQRWTAPFKSGRKTPAPLLVIQGDSLKDVVALVDTSSAENWADLESADRMNLVPLGPPAFATQPVHVNDPARSFLCVSSRLRVGQIQVETGLFFVRNWQAPLEILDRGFSDPHPRCVLGMRFLQPFAYAQFDFPGRQLTLSTDDPYRPASAGLLASLPIQPRAWALTVDGELDGETVPVVLDTGGDYGLAMIDPPAEPVSLRLGDWTLPPTMAIDARQAGLQLDRKVHLGLAILGDYVLTLDQANRLVHIQQPGE